MQYNYHMENSMPISMQWFWPLFLYVIGGVIALVGAYLIWRKEKENPGTESLASVLIFASTWVLSIAAGLISSTFEAKLFWLQARYMSISLLGMTFYITEFMQN